MRHIALPAIRRCIACALAVLCALLLALSTQTGGVVGTASAAQGEVVRGTVTADLALYEAPDGLLEPVDYLSAGFTFQALDLGDGWYAAKFDGAARYFDDASAFALYTAPDATVMRAAVVGGPLEVLLAPASGAMPCTSFANGATIQFCQFNDAWYMARLGDGTVCYIDASRVRLFAPVEEGTLVRWAGEGGARVYEAPDAQSTLLATLEAGRKLWFADFDAEWLMASMSIDGATRTVFVPKGDVVLEEPVVPEPEPDPQPEPAPDPGAATWVIATVAAEGKQSPSWDSATLVTFRKGAVLNALPVDGGWYLVVFEGETMYLSEDVVDAIPSSSYAVYDRFYDVSLAEAVRIENNGSWIVGNDVGNKATEADLATYMDPANFPQGTSGFFQFLVLTQPLGVSVATLDAQLAGKGVLEGQGRAFHDAAYAYGINEAYLVSHALHETGNGWSQLAQGVWYDPATETASVEKRSDSDVLVYNVYGIGAVDSNPLNGGAKYAYDRKWFTVYDAVYGGAQLIGRTYLYSDDQAGFGYASTLSGQNTLYKMLFHPEWVEVYREKPWHQYATDVAWANAQTYYYTTMLADYDNYSLVFEVPSYAA